MKTDESVSQPSSVAGPDEVKDFVFTSQFLATLLAGSRHEGGLSEQSRHVLTEMPKLFIQGRSASTITYEAVSEDLNPWAMLYRGSEDPQNAMWWSAQVFTDDEAAEAMTEAADELARLIPGDLLIDALRDLALLFTKNIASKTLTVVYETPGPLELCRDFTIAELDELLPQTIRNATTH